MPQLPWLFCLLSCCFHPTCTCTCCSAKDTFHSAGGSYVPRPLCWPRAALASSLHMSFLSSIFIQRGSRASRVGGTPPMRVRDWCAQPEPSSQQAEFMQRLQSHTVVSWALSASQSSQASSPAPCPILASPCKATPQPLALTAAAPEAGPPPGPSPVQPPPSAAGAGL